MPTSPNLVSETITYSTVPSSKLLKLHNISHGVRVGVIVYSDNKVFAT
jgi:hypothetical protein